MIITFGRLLGRNAKNCRLTADLPAPILTVAVGAAGVFTARDAGAAILPNPHFCRFRNNIAGCAKKKGINGLPG